MSPPRFFWIDVSRAQAEILVSAFQKMNCSNFVMYYRNQKENSNFCGKQVLQGVLLFDIKRHKYLVKLVRVCIEHFYRYVLEGFQNIIVYQCSLDNITKRAIIGRRAGWEYHIIGNAKIFFMNEETSTSASEEDFIPRQRTSGENKRIEESESSEEDFIPRQKTSGKIERIEESESGEDNLTSRQRDFGSTITLEESESSSEDDFIPTQKRSGKRKRIDVSDDEQVSVFVPSVIPEDNIAPGEKLRWYNDIARKDYNDNVEKERTNPNGPGYIYLIKIKNLPYIKIGIAADVDSRLATLQTGNPFPLELIGKKYFAHGKYNAEQMLHTKFREFRLHGEWFMIDSKIATILSTLNLQESPAVINIVKQTLNSIEDPGSFY